MRKLAFFAIIAVLLSACTLKIDIAGAENADFNNLSKQAASDASFRTADKITANTLIIIPDTNKIASKINDPGTGIKELYTFPVGKFMLTAMESAAPAYFENYTIAHESDSYKYADFNVRMNFSSLDLVNETVGFSECYTKIKTGLSMEVLDSSGSRIYEKSTESDWCQKGRNCFSSKEFEDSLVYLGVKSVSASYSEMFSTLSMIKFVREYLSSLKPQQKAAPAVEIDEGAADKLRKAFENGHISADQLGRAVNEVGSGQHSKLLDAFINGEIDEINFGNLY